MIEELKNIKWHVIGLSEMKRSGEGLTELNEGLWLYESDKLEDKPDSKGTAFLINKNVKDHRKSELTKKE